MRQKSCKGCGRVFVPATKHIYLCPECHARAKSSGVVRERVCRQCGKPFPGGPRAWYCPDCRAERAREHKRCHQQRGPARPLGSVDQCTACGRDYIVTGARQRYCPACAGTEVGRRVREHKRQYAADRAEQMAEYKAAMSANRNVCVICGRVFDADVPTVTCCAACDSVRRKNNQRAADAKRSPRKRSNDND